MRNVFGRMLAGQQLSPIGIGCARWSITEPTNDAEAKRILGYALDLGIGYIDTALAYTTKDQESHNESLIARVLSERGHPEHVLVGTKGGHFRTGSSWVIDGRPETIRKHCEISLRTLSTDTLDLYYLHWPDPQVPFDVSVGSLEELRAEGKVRAIGVSNVTLDQLDTALSIAPIAAVQNHFSPFDRSDRELVRACESRGITYIAYSPLGGTRHHTPAAQLSIAAARIAAELGVTIETILLAWVLGISRSIIPLTGARRKSTLLASYQATELELTTEQLAAITADLELE